MTEHPPACFHCGEPCPDDGILQIERDGRFLPVCCAGCKAVAELILSSGLGRYYRFREGEALKALEDVESFEADWRACDDRQALWGEQLPGGKRELLLQTEGVRCAACAWLIRSRLELLEGVEQASVDVGTGFTRIVWDPSAQRLSRLASELVRFGYRPHLPLAGAEEHGRLQERRLALRRMGVAGLGMMQVMMYAVGLYAGEALGISRGARGFLEWTSLLVAIPVVFYSARPFFTGAVDSLRAGRPGMDVPVALAVGVAFTASCVNFLRGTGLVYFDSVVMFVFFLSVARYLQMAGRHRNLQAGTALARLLPEWAERLDGERTVRIPASDLAVGDRVRVRPGEAFPADGVIEAGTTDVDESLLTGESRPRYRAPGDAVVGGSINRSQAVTVLVEAVGEDSALSALGRMLVRAQARGSRLGTLSERVAGGFVVGVLLLAAVTAMFWWVRDASVAMQATLAVLVVSCPCALSLATPTALAASGRKLLENGILLTRGDALEALAKADAAVFDKTGTLTRGEPEVAAVTVNPDRAGHSRELALRVAASLETQSSHPVARAFSGADELLEVSEVRHLPHAGLTGRIAGTVFRLGIAEFAGVPRDLAVSHDSAVWLADDRGWIARFDLADPLRPGSLETVVSMREDGLALSILSGDGAASVAEVATRLGIEDWFARQNPENKMEYVTLLQEQGRVVLMVGDGVNDAPVLAAADVSVTVQGASELANSAADLVVTGESLEWLEVARRTARNTKRVITQNITWAVAYNLLAVPLAASGALQPWMAALGMSASSLLVAANAARLARNRGDSRQTVEARESTVPA